MWCRSLDRYHVVTPVCIDICSVSEKKQSYQEKFWFFLPWYAFLLFKFRRLHWKNTMNFRVFDPRTRFLFQMTVCQFWSNHSEKKVILDQLNELAFVDRSHSPSDQLIAFSYERLFTRYENEYLSSKVASLFGQVFVSRQSLSHKHYQSTYQPPEGVYLPKKLTRSRWVGAFNSAHIPVTAFS